MANHVCCKTPINFWGPDWNNYSKTCRVCVILPRLFPILCSLYNSIINAICLFGWRSTFATLWQVNIPGHIRDMETNVSTCLFGLSSWFFKIWTQSSHRMWTTRFASPLCNSECPFATTILAMQNLCFTS